MLTIHDDGFKRFGQVVEINTDEIVNYLNTTPVPETGNIYVASDENFEKLESIKELEKRYYGAHRMQAGYCNGNNQLLNCEEYHDCVEINVAANDATLFLGTLDDIHNGVLDSACLIEVFVKKGEAFLMYPGTLHFSPCVVNKTPFHMAILLSKGTNTPVDREESDPKYWMKNKWLLAHKDTIQASKGAYIGIVGENRRASMVE